MEFALGYLVGAGVNGLFALAIIIVLAVVIYNVWGIE